MRVCIASKFPPIEGGISARTYWGVRELLDQGARVTVVTNANEVEDEYRISGCDEHLDGLVWEHDLELRFLPEPAPWHVPNSPNFLERLLNELLGVLESDTWDRIESGYLVPYGIAGHLASKLTGIPHVVRHGGSEISKFLGHPAYSRLLQDVLADAQTVITDEGHRGLLAGYATNLECRPVYEPYVPAFQQAPAETHEGPRVVAYIGKINYHWRRKGLDRIINWYTDQEWPETTLRIIGQGVGKADFEEWMHARLGYALPIEPFVPPWDMPALLRSVDAVFALDADPTVQNTSMLAMEARALGVEVIGLI